MARGAVWLFGSPIPSVCAEERSGQRIRARDCLSEASSSETPLDASTAGCPKRSAGTQTVGSPFLCLLSFGEAKESESPAGANTRLPPSAKAYGPIGPPSPKRPTTNQPTINSIATSAHPTSARAQFNQNLNPTQHLQRRTPRRQLLQLRPEHSRLLPPPRMAQGRHQHAQRLP